MVKLIDAEHINRGLNDAWLSLVERCVRDAEVAGSNPVASTPWQGRWRSFIGSPVFLCSKSDTADEEYRAMGFFCGTFHCNMVKYKKCIEY